MAKEAVSGVNEFKGVSDLLHEIQIERALTLRYLSDSLKSSRDQLVVQRLSTNEAIESLEELLKKEKTSIPNNTIKDSIHFIRSLADNFANIDSIDPFYIHSKQILFDHITSRIRLSGNREINNFFEDHLFLIYSKDYLAQIRSEVGKSLSSKNFTVQSYGSFSSLKGIHDLNLEKFRSIASPELIRYFNANYQGAYVEATYQAISEIFTSGRIDFAALDFEKWWGSSTASINILKSVEEHSIHLIREKAEVVLSQATRRVIVHSAIALIVILAIIFIVSYILRQILEAIQKLKKAANQVAKGEVEIDTGVHTKDEFGELATSFDQMISINRKFAEAADTIGKGDYSRTVDLRSDKDLLGKALETMRVNLLELSIENKRRTWLLTGNKEMNDSIRGEKDVFDIGQDIIKQLSKYLHAQIGALYTEDSGKLVLTGSYAFPARKNNANQFAFGEGLVGQAALEKTPIVFSEVPKDYIRIHSGLGSVHPKEIIVYPVLFDKQVKAVIEIGKAEGFTENDMELLQLVSENIGIAIQSAQSRKRMKELLEETQRQAEELETQQEELKQTNEELLEKTELLEKSESELKVQQEELQQTNEELEEKANLLEEQKEKLEHAKMDIEMKAREVEQTSRYKSEFLANMSHELRTPLNSVLILAQLLSENKSKTLGEKEVEFAKNIYTAGSDLLMLINEILDLSKIESGKMELELESFDLSEIVKHMNAMFSQVAKNKNIEFTIQQKAHYRIETDKQKVEQILRNLLSNAFKFTPQGGKVQLVIDIDQKSKAYKIGAEENAVIVFKVEDNGIGIPREKHSIIFQAFQQADGSTKRKYGGTGLGLSISRELASALGGSIELESHPGKGSCFSLVLPAKFENTNDLQVLEKSHEPDSLQSIKQIPSYNHEDHSNMPDDRNGIGNRDKLILIIEDDVSFSGLLLDFVRGRNYKGIIANDGIKGISYARHYKPDAIILDMKIPGMDGTEVLKQLKIDPLLSHIPVQIISGYDRRREGMELGAFDFMQKPVNSEDLRMAFDRIESFQNKKLKKLLIVEDDPQQNRSICELIGNGDVKCDNAYSGKEAFELLGKEQYECIIVDLGLPDMNGFGFLQKIKENESLKNIPVIVYTGRDLSKEESKRLNKLADTVVLKTVDSHERLFDETSLFLHRVKSKLPKEKQNLINRLHKTDEVLKGKRALLVDDDIRNIYSLSNILEEEGMECLTADNGKTAIRILKEQSSIDIVLMDVMMPEMDGFEATKAIRSDPRLAKLPVIALTAKAMKGDKEKCLEAGMSDYISKPINNEQLLSLLRVWLYR